MWKYRIAAAVTLVVTPILLNACTKGLTKSAAAQSPAAGTATSADRNANTAKAAKASTGPTGVTGRISTIAPTGSTCVPAGHRDITDSDDEMVRINSIADDLQLVKALPDDYADPRDLIEKFRKFGASLAKPISVEETDAIVNQALERSPKTAPSGWKATPHENAHVVPAADRSYYLRPTLLALAIYESAFADADASQLERQKELAQTIMNFAVKPELAMVAFQRGFRVATSTKTGLALKPADAQMLVLAALRQPGGVDRVLTFVESLKGSLDSHETLKRALEVAGKDSCLSLEELQNSPR